MVPQLEPLLAVELSQALTEPSQALVDRASRASSEAPVDRLQAAVDRVSRGPSEAAVD